MKTRKKLIRINKTTKITRPEIKNINNYRVIFIKSNSPLLSIQSYIFNGFIRETRDDVGVNHLLEHVLANAYKKCKKFNCFEYLTQLGIEYNASTSDNILNYYTFGLNSDVDKMLDYITKITVTPIFNNKLVNREKQAVHNEVLAWMDNSKYKLHNRVAKLFYNLEGLQYSLDAEQQIKNLKKFNSKNLQEYYSKNYNNNNTLFIVSGNYNKQKIIEGFKSRLSYKPKQEKIDYNNIKCFTNLKTTEFLKNEKLNGTQIYLSFPTRLKYNSKELIVLKLAKDVLNYYFFQILRIKNKLVYSTQLSLDVNVCGSSIDLYVNTKNENLLKVLKLLKYIINYYKKNKLSKEEIEPFKKQFLVKHHNTMLGPKGLANMYGKQYIYQHFLNTKILYPQTIKNIYTNITPKDIQESICKNFDFNKLVCVYSNKDKSVKFKF